MSNIIEFPGYSENVVDALKKLTREIEETPELAEHMVVVMGAANGVARYRAFGKAFTKAEAVGLVEYGKFLIIGVRA